MLRDKSSTKFCKIFYPKWLPWDLLTWKHVECLQKDGNINTFVSMDWFFLKKERCTTHTKHNICLLLIYYFPFNWKSQCLQAPWLSNAYVIQRYVPVPFQEMKGHHSWSGKKGESKQVKWGEKFKNIFFTNSLMFNRWFFRKCVE